MHFTILKEYNNNTDLTALEVRPLRSGRKKRSFGKIDITSSIFNAQRVACALSAVDVECYNPGVSHSTLLLCIGFEFDREKPAPSSLCQQGM